MLPSAGRPGAPPPPPLPGAAGVPPAPGVPLVPQIKMVELTKPKLQLPPGLKLKAFTWKRIVLDHDSDPWQVAKEDLKGHDPKWKDKEVVWREI